MFPEPEFKVIPTGYKAIWDDLNIVVYLERPRQDRHSEILADVMVYFGKERLEQTILNLSKASTRHSFSKLLALRVNDMDWTSVINWAAILCTQRFREGSPAVRISDIPPRVKPRFRVEPLVFEDENNLIFGDGDSGKTLLAYLLAVMVQDNFAAVGMVPFVGNCLILDYETGELTAMENIRAIRAGLGVKVPGPGEPDILYRYCTQSLASDIEAIQAIVAENNIVFIIVDSMGMACGGDIERLEDVRVYFAALRSLKITVLSLHHITKQGESSKPFGSVYAYNIPRSLFLAKAEKDSDESFINMGLYHKKCNVARKVKPIGLRIDFEAEDEANVKITFTDTDLASIPELAAGLSTRARIREALKDGPMTTPELMAELDISRTNADQSLKRLRDNKTVVKKGAKWGLAYAEGLI